MTMSNFRSLASFSMGVQARSLVPALGSADPLVLVDLHHSPLAQLGNLAQLCQLALDRLPVGGGHAGIDRRALRLAHGDGAPRADRRSTVRKVSTALLRRVQSLREAPARR